ncbi:MAG: DUF6090 family protein [Cyclobacteriaceae bacterium]
MKLFRKFRQNQISKGKLKKYLLYAIGEILLVMIGITLAFQLSDWNDNRINRAAEIKYYENIRDQITDDKELIQGQLDYNNRHMVQFEYANQIIESNDKSKLDTLGLIAKKLTEYSDFDRQGNIYETMVNSGEIKLLHNDKIINGTRELEEIYMHINRMENIHYDVLMRYVAPSVMNSIKWSTSKIQKPEVLYTFEFQNLTLALMQVMEEKDDTYNQAIREIEELTALINEELTIE